ncbi:Response regulator MprA [Paenibacillus solanacearum]|uniref:Response regulator MprA n=1 Tax=Paenibacillus solanacearum TaxID=2048548 RepID=A0A916K419_9BACL|nr:response regulator transcription factor [Paenibacillus solanacearum]CAG7626157.1 Response regulator MprA [Paenibacillus solanacearum]
MKILVVEDDLSMQKSICMGLRKFSYAVDAASDGEEALRMVEIHEYDALVLDWNLPRIDGIDVLREIRKNNQDIKILILSARSEVEDKIFGLDTGANDYMAKPFHFKELEARLRALLRRRFTQTDTRMSHGELLIDTALKTAYVKGNLMELTKKEYGILEYLMLNKDKVVSAEEIMEHLWDSSFDGFSNSLKVHINSLKKKLAALLGEQEVIKNRRGLGYYIAEVPLDAY